MSDSCRRIRTAIVTAWWLPIAIPVALSGFLTFGILWGLGPPGSNLADKNKASDPNYYQSRCDQSVANGFLPLESDVVATARNKISAEAKSHAEYQPDYPDYCDLAAQYRSAAATESSRNSAWIVAFLTLIGVFFLWRTVVYTKRILEETKEIGLSQTKAYLSISELSIGTAENGGAINFTAICDNSGNSPATKIEASLRVKLVGLNGSDLTFWKSMFFHDIPPRGKSKGNCLIDIADLSKIGVVEDYKNLHIIFADAVLVGENVFGASEIGIFSFMTFYENGQCLTSTTPKSLVTFSNELFFDQKIMPDHLRNLKLRDRKAGQ